MAANKCAHIVKHLVKTDSLLPESAGRTGESVVLIETNVFDSSVDILSLLKLLINLLHSVTQIPCCHNVPYIFDMGAIFMTWVFQLYEKLKRTRGGREGVRVGGKEQERGLRKKRAAGRTAEKVTHKGRLKRNLL